MLDQRPQDFHRLTQSGELDSRVRELDQMMVEDFERQEDEVMAALMKANTWGTQAGTQEFHMRRLQAWGEVVAQYLPVVIDSA